MNNLLYIVAVILIIGWLLGYFALSAGGYHSFAACYCGNSHISAGYPGKENYVEFTVCNELCELYKINIKSYNNHSEPATYL